LLSRMDLHLDAYGVFAGAHDASGANFGFVVAAPAELAFDALEIPLESGPIELLVLEDAPEQAEQSWRALCGEPCLDFRFVLARDPVETHGIDRVPAWRQ